MKATFQLLPKLTFLLGISCTLSVGMARSDSFEKEAKQILTAAVSRETGQRLADHELESPPVWDGMAATNGRLYLATKSGSVLCLTGSQ